MKSETRNTQGEKAAQALSADGSRSSCSLVHTCTWKAGEAPFCGAHRPPTIQHQPIMGANLSGEFSPSKGVHRLPGVSQMEFGPAEHGALAGARSWGPVAWPLPAPFGAQEVGASGGDVMIYFLRHRAASKT